MHRKNDKPKQDLTIYTNELRYMIHHMSPMFSTANTTTKASTNYDKANDIINILSNGLVTINNNFIVNMKLFTDYNNNNNNCTIQSNNRSANRQIRPIYKGERKVKESPYKEYANKFEEAFNKKYKLIPSLNTKKSNSINNYNKVHINSNQSISSLANKTERSTDKIKFHSLYNTTLNCKQQHKENVNVTPHKQSITLLYKRKQPPIPKSGQRNEIKVSKYLYINSKRDNSTNNNNNNIKHKSFRSNSNISISSLKSAKLKINTNNNTHIHNKTNSHHSLRKQFSIYINSDKYLLSK
jgi:hypothetical protein